MSAAGTSQESNRQTNALREIAIMIRFILRRDRIRIAVWVISIVFFLVATATAFPGIYEDDVSRQARAELMASPATRAMAGPGHGLEDYTFGAMMTQELLAFTAIAVAIMSILLVVRHTRADEAEGRSELTQAYSASRYSALVAAIVVVSGVNILLGVITAVGLGSTGVESITWASSWLFGAALASVGLVFTGVAAATAQFTQTSRAAASLAGLVIGATYLFRAVGDVGENMMSWLSPFGWAQATMAYVDDRWWPLLPAALTSIALVGLAIYVNNRRDYGEGIIQTKAGRTRASSLLRSPLMLALRLQKVSLISWGLALFTFGIVYGSLVGEVENFVARVDNIQFDMGDSVIEGFLGTIVSMLALLGAVYTVTAILRLRKEETNGRAEMILTTPVSSTRWALSHITIALLGGILVTLAAALGLSISAAVVLDDPGMILRLLESAAVYAPLFVLLVGTAIALFGLAARAITTVWLLIAYMVVVWMFGLFLQFPQWAINLSPMEHVPLLPAQELKWLPLTVMFLIGLVLLTGGLWLLHRRDLTTN